MPHGAWRLLVDTANNSPPVIAEDAAALAPVWPEPRYPLQCRSLVVLSRPDVRP